MPVTRRGVLKLFGFTAVAGLIYESFVLRRRMKALAGRLNEPLADRTTGPLSDDTLRTLMAATHGLLGTEIEPTHYETFFRWRTEHVPGYLRLYEEFAARIERSAEHSDGRSFSVHTPSERLRLLDESVPVPDPRRWIDRVKMSLFARDRQNFDFRWRIVGEVLALFACTDALVQIGYDAWPGTARGLENYRHRLPAQSNL